METYRKKTEKNIYCDCMSFGDSSTVHNPLKQSIAFIKAYLDTLLQGLLMEPFLVLVRRAGTPDLGRGGLSFPLPHGSTGLVTYKDRYMTKRNCATVFMFEFLCKFPVWFRQSDQGSFTNYVDIFLAFSTNYPPSLTVSTL